MPADCRFCERLSAEADLPPLFLWAAGCLSELCDNENVRYGIAQDSSPA